MIGDLFSGLDQEQLPFVEARGASVRLQYTVSGENYVQVIAITHAELTLFVRPALLNAAQRQVQLVALPGAVLHQNAIDGRFTVIPWAHGASSFGD